VLRALLTVVVLSASLGVVSATANTAAPSTTVMFRGSYILDSHASQPTFKPTSLQCIPGSRQYETETVKWTIRFVGPAVPTDGAVTLHQRSERVSGPHVWDERSQRCAGKPSGHLVCRSHFTPGGSQLRIRATGRTWTFHPRLVLTSNSDGCKGEVHNEHPDCGARDPTAIRDFAFLTQLRREAPQLDRPGRTASFDVHRSKACAKTGPKAQPGSLNTQLIRQRTTARYTGTLTVSP
jgi:hypothetical protein